MRLRLLGAVGALLLVCSIPSYAAYVETFDADNANFNYGYDTGFNNPQNSAAWVSSGGNPDGYISGNAIDNGTAKGLYAIWTYDTSLYGDMNGLTMTIDTKVTGNVTGNAQFYVGRDGSYYIDGIWAIGSDTAWATHTTALNTTEFTPWTGATLSLADVLAAPDDIGIFFGGNLAGGSGSVMVDNFGTVVPVPAAVWLFGSGLLGLVGVARRKKSV